MSATTPWTTSHPVTGPRLDAESAVAVARAVATDLAQHAATVDEDGTWPEDGVRHLRTSGLLGLLVPVDRGGSGLGVREMVAVAGELAAGCASTAMIWAMHCQQVSVLVAHGSGPVVEEVLTAVGAGDCLLGSMTTEPGKGGHLLTALAPLEVDDDGMLVVEREAPVVTGGRHADAFLVTMRARPDAAPHEVSLVVVRRADAEITTRTGWQTTGMRGTDSVGVRLTARLPADAVVGEQGSFADAAVRTMVPVGHLAWAAVWLGVARAAAASVVALLRSPGKRPRDVGASDLAAAALARVRLRLDAAGAYLASCADEYEALVARGTDIEAVRAVPFQLHINGVKVLVSEEASRAVDEMVTLVGMRHGYMRPSPVERAARDLRSAALMYSNERLLVANGRLAVLDREVVLLGIADLTSAGPR